MATWTYSDIAQATRQVSGRLSLAELSNQQLQDHINRYLQYEFPAEVKLNRNYTQYSFNTIPNQQDYTMSANFTNFVPPATVDRLVVDFYQDPALFDAEQFQSFTRLNQWTGDGSTTAFSSTLSSLIPIQAGTVVVDDTVEVFNDDGLGNLTGTEGGSGTVNYSTGAIAVTFATAPTDGQSIQVGLVALKTGRPESVLMYSDKFRMFPVPDRAYSFQIQAYTLLLVQQANGSTTNSFDDASDRPLLDEWGPAIYLGAARRIVSEFGEMQRYKEITELYKEQIAYILVRTCVDLESTRSRPMF